MNSISFKRIEITGADQLDDAAMEIHKNSGPFKVFAFYGDMGAGKTTLIQRICKYLGVESSVTSPTFSIVNEYVSGEGQPVYHFDFYRIRDIREAFDLGYENYFFSGYYCFIEWPEKIHGLLDFPHLEIRISVSDQKRIVTLHA